MDHSIFLLVKDSQDDCRDVIRHRDGNLRVRVYCLSKDRYEPDASELQFYGNDNGEVLAFETIGYDGSDPLLVIEAIRWYADYIENSKMEILAENPSLSGPDQDKLFFR